MGRKTAKMLGLVLAGSMVISMTSPVADAAAKMSLSKKKITITQGEKVTLKVKKAKKKVKWSVTKGKKVIKLSKKKKASVVITGKKAGKAVVTAKAGKKKLTCKVTVKAANKMFSRHRNRRQPLLQQLHGRRRLLQHITGNHCTNIRTDG